jgi:rhamnulokinase
MNKRSFLAFDLGAESGRAVLGSLQDQTLHLQEISRFPNSMVFISGHWRWNIFRLFEEMLAALRLCTESCTNSLESLGVDTWGVDFGLLGPHGVFLDLPVTYRDTRTEGIMEKVFQRLDRERIYGLTGIQFLRFNTLFQLFALRLQGSPLLDLAQDLLFMPDLFNFMLTGGKSTEFTYATTSQLVNPGTQSWEPELFDKLELPLSLMQPIIASGTCVGSLRKDLAREYGMSELPVVAGAQHDTAAAIVAAPAQGKNWAYISSGTWSLMGIEIESPIMNKKALDLNFTNEGGVGNRFRFLKNIAGLWLLQGCRQAWSKDRSVAYADLIQAAREAPAFRSLIDPDAELFLNPQDMPEAVCRFCRDSGQPIPDSVSAMVRCILESLALKYRFVLDQLRSVALESIDRIHIIGGGSRNAMLCQFTANATGLPVMAGPAEATAAGNLMMQAKSRGAVKDLAEIRQIIRRSFTLETYHPQDTRDWDAAYARFQDLLQ